MIIIEGHARAKVVNATDEEHAWLRNYLSFPRAGAGGRWTRQGEDRDWLLAMDGTFPAGLLPGLLAHAPEDGHQVQVLSKCHVTPRDPEADLGWLRDYQRAAIEAAIARRRGVIKLPTGSGKGELVVALARAIPCEWLFLVHRSTLVEQTAARFFQRNLEHGIDLGVPGLIGEGSWTEGERLTFATFQSLGAALKRGDKRATDLLGRVRGIVVDEAHSVGAEMFWRVTMAASKAAYRIGLSGTPFARGDKKSHWIVAALGPQIAETKAQVLVDAGIIARPTITMATVRHPPCRASTYNGVYGSLIVRSAVRNAAIVAMTVSAPKPAFVFVKEREHARRLEADLLRSGVRAQTVWGDHSSDWRKSALKSLAAGRLDAIVCTVIFQEGVDVPELRSVVIAAGGRSTIAAIQRVGRGMRIDRDAAGNVREGGDRFDVFDVMDEGHPWLERASKDRRRAYLREGYQVLAPR